MKKILNIMSLVNFCNRVIEYSFYIIFFFVPLFFLGNTSELFEFNKMWVVFGLTILIGVCWISRMIVERSIDIRRTPLDIPLLFFLISQFISTIVSLDSHVSWWGYYSRFNGGFYSTLCYVFLYFAFVSNLGVVHVFRILKISMLSGLISALWGFPSHFGYDPTCFVFRGTLDTNCWTEAFRPTVRVFSTLGQPAWFAAYLDILLPVSISFTLVSAYRKKLWSIIFYLALTLLFFSCLIFTKTRAGTDAFYAVNFIFWAALFYKKLFPTKWLTKYFIGIHIGFVFCILVFGYPTSSIDRFVRPIFAANTVAYADSSPTSQQPAKKTINITDSWDIRLIVWKGAIDAWRANPIFGTGVETFAFAYYKHRPAEHNLTSEWDYLYNKAHNEYLNYLTTTGVFGLGSYLLFISVFIFLAGISFFKRNGSGTNKETQSLHKHSNKDQIKEYKSTKLLTTGLFCGWLSILITNFSGFSVVIVNLYFFLIPVFVFLVNGTIGKTNFRFSFGESEKRGKDLNLLQWILTIVIFIFGANMLLGLFRYWYADTVYALGANLNRALAYKEAFPFLKEAVTIVPTEPVYVDEYAVNLATLAEALYYNNDATNGAEFAKEAVSLNTSLLHDHPNNVVFWKNRLRIFYSLANGDSSNRNVFYDEALNALEKARELAPTDAKIAYNQGLLLGQSGDLRGGVRVLEETVRLKPDYYDAYVALGLLYRQMAIDPSNPSPASESAEAVIVNQQMSDKAIETYEYILENLSPDNEEIRETLEEWKF